MEKILLLLRFIVDHFLIESHKGEGAGRENEKV